jgi:hypothetical protein
MAGIRGKSGPPANQNAFKHGLAGISQRRVNGALNPTEQAIREDILAGLIADKGGERQIGTAERILAEIIASDISLLVTFNQELYFLKRREVWPGTESNCRHEDFQSSVSTETMCHYWSLFVSIQAFKGCLSRSIFPIRTHSGI